MALIFCLRPACWAPYIAGTPSGNACLGSGLSAGNAESLTDSMGVHTGAHTQTHTAMQRMDFSLLPSRAHHRKQERGSNEGKEMVEAEKWTDILYLPHTFSVKHVDYPAERREAF